MNLPHGSYKRNAFDSRLLSVTHDGVILIRPDTLQRRERRISRLYLSVRKSEAQCRSQCVEENSIVVNDENTESSHCHVSRRKILSPIPLDALCPICTGLTHCPRQLPLMPIPPKVPAFLAGGDNLADQSQFCLSAGIPWQSVRASMRPSPVQRDRHCGSQQISLYANVLNEFRCSESC